jgi:hypothetical protein
MIEYMVGKGCWGVTYERGIFSSLAYKVGVALLYKRVELGVGGKENILRRGADRPN